MKGQVATMNVLLLLFLFFLSILLSRDAVSGSPMSSTILPGNNLGTDVASALKVLELASVSILDSSSVTELLPFTTISYAQTIDGSM